MEIHLLERIQEADQVLLSWVEENPKKAVIYDVAIKILGIYSLTIFSYLGLFVGSMLLFDSLFLDRAIVIKFHIIKKDFLRFYKEEGENKLLMIQGVMENAALTILPQKKESGGTGI